jgi:hypothetical protein
MDDILLQRAKRPLKYPSTWFTTYCIDMLKIATKMLGRKDLCLFFT